MTFEAEWSGLPNRQAIEFFRQKTTLPTRTWKDLEGAMHARAFVVAGAARDDLLSDLRAAIDEAIAEGTTLEAFRKRFDETVAKTGWAYNGGRNWRTRVIYETNLRTAHAVGRHRQMSDPAVVRRRPFWRYRHNDAVAHPRPHHRAWDGTVLAHDDPWWRTHYPPNGWGCQCFVQSLGPRDLARLGKTGPDTAPTDPDSTAGIDRGWEHNPGEAANGRPGEFEKKRIELPGKRPPEYPWLPAKLTPRPPPVPLGTVVRSPAELEAALPKGLYTDPMGESVEVGQDLLDHFLDDSVKDRSTRSPYLPLVPDVITRPMEIWFGFFRQDDGKVVLVRRYSVAYQLDKGRSLGVAVDTTHGKPVALTITQFSDLKQNGRMRYGRLAWPWPQRESGPEPGDGSS